MTRYKQRGMRTIDQRLSLDSSSTLESMRSNVFEFAMFQRLSSANLTTIDLATPTTPAARYTHRGYLRKRQNTPRAKKSFRKAAPWSSVQKCISFIKASDLRSSSTPSAYWTCQRLGPRTPGTHLLGFRLVPLETAASRCQFFPTNSTSVLDSTKFTA